MQGNPSFIINKFPWSNFNIMSKSNKLKLKWSNLQTQFQKNGSGLLSKTKPKTSQKIMEKLLLPIYKSSVTILSKC